MFVENIPESFWFALTVVELSESKNASGIRNNLDFHKYITDKILLNMHLFLNKKAYLQNSYMAIVDIVNLMK